MTASMVNVVMPTTREEFGAGLWSDPRDKDNLIEPSEGGEPKLHEMMDFQSWKQRREELLREAELNHLAKRMRAATRSASLQDRG